MRAISKYVRYFNDFDEYDAFYETHEHFGYRTDIVEDKKWIAADAQYECKTAMTALKRFFKAIAEINLLADWEDCVKDDYNGFMEYLIERNEYPEENRRHMDWCFGLSKNSASNFSRCEPGEWAYCIEEIEDGLWYISLKVAK